MQSHKRVGNKKRLTRHLGQLLEQPSLKGLAGSDGPGGGAATLKGLTGSDGAGGGVAALRGLAGADREGRGTG